jgi:hypothetical protein
VCLQSNVDICLFHCPSYPSYFNEEISTFSLGAPFLDSSLPFVYHALANAFTCLSQYEGLLGFCLSIKRKRTGFPGKLEIVHDY